MSDLSGVEGITSSILEEAVPTHSNSDFISEVFSRAPCGFALLDASWRIICSNRFFIALNGAGTELAPFVYDSLFPFMNDTLENGKTTTNLEMSARRPDEKIEHYIVTIFPVTLGLSQGPLVAVLFIDITERMEARAELEWNQKRLKNITDVIPMLVTYIDRDYRYRFNNKTYDEWFNTPYQSIRGRHAEEVLGKEGFAICKPWMDRALAGENVVWERPLFHPKMGWRQVQIYYAPDIDHSGYVNGIVAAVRDVTEERELQRRLELQHKKLKDLLSQVPALIWESWEKTDSTLLRTNFMSEYVKKMLGYAPEQWVSMLDFWTLVAHPDDRKKITDAIESFLRSGQGGALEARLFKSDGSLVHAASYIEVISDEKEGPIGLRGVTIDITERKRMESDLRTTSEQLKEAVRVRDDFLSIAAHELRTPITVVKLQNQMLSRLSASPEGLHRVSAQQLHEVLSTSSAQLDNLTRLVDELLDVTRIAAGKLKITFSPTDLSEVASTVIAAFQGQAERHRIQLDRQGPVVGGWDRFRLEQVVTNLVSNALKYGEGKPIHVRVFQDGDKAVLEVSDQGIGIDPKDHERIFNRFERAVDHRHISGWGLGLYITRQIVDAHSGAINVRSQLKQGATFTVTLPLQLAPQP